MNILLVEDNEGDIELTKIAFKRGCKSCEILVVNDGGEALDYLLKRGDYRDKITPDLVLIDLNMPRMGGKEFLDAAKRNEAIKSVPVIILTSSQNPAEILECYKRHANCYIMKPSGLEELVSMARQIESFWAGLARLPTNQEIL